ncbi:hypothetical protein RFI_17325 [Reticulomyxa filosa]|uniref:Uncharacterized protein n=1 Tax=Reticulomyxa filosa TaxID=46433 RepID=X6N0W9_RETFI|nr:hypothetical protein RFI_17325 [Reticulomyxa filosa]|eukprot:ETO19895.1 hypothetical protein RFI_17325 [Reticulomyxa filosa]
MNTKEITWDETKFVWSDSSKVSYIDWRSGEPQPDHYKAVLSKSTEQWTSMPYGDSTEGVQYGLCKFDGRYTPSFLYRSGRIDSPSSINNAESLRQAILNVQTTSDFCETLNPVLYTVLVFFFLLLFCLPCNSELCPDSGSLTDVGKYYVIKFSEPNWSDSPSQWEFEFSFLGANKVAIYVDKNEYFYTDSVDKLQNAVIVTTSKLKSGWHVIELYVYTKEDKCEDDSQIQWAFKRGNEQNYQKLTIDNLLKCLQKNAHIDQTCLILPYSMCVDVGGLPCHMRADCLVDLCDTYLTDCVNDIECGDAMTEIFRTGIAYMDESAYKLWKKVANCSLACCALEDKFVITPQNKTKQGEYDALNKMQSDTVWFSVISTDLNIAKAALRFYQLDSETHYYSNENTFITITFAPTQIVIELFFLFFKKILSFLQKKDDTDAVIKTISQGSHPSFLDEDIMRPYWVKITTNEATAQTLVYIGLKYNDHDSSTLLATVILNEVVPYTMLYVAVSDDLPSDWRFFFYQSPYSYCKNDNEMYQVYQSLSQQSSCAFFNLDYENQCCGQVCLYLNHEPCLQYLIETNEYDNNNALWVQTCTYQRCTESATDEAGNLMINYDASTCSMCEVVAGTWCALTGLCVFDADVYCPDEIELLGQGNTNQYFFWLPTYPCYSTDALNKCTKNNECSPSWKTFQKYEQINPNVNFQLPFAVADCTRKHCCTDYKTICFVCLQTCMKMFVLLEANDPNTPTDCDVYQEFSCSQQFCSDFFFECYSTEGCLDVVQQYLTNYYHLNNADYAAIHSIEGDKIFAALLNCSAYQCCNFEWVYTAELAAVPPRNDSGGGGDDGGNGGGNGDGNGSGSSSGSAVPLWAIPILVFVIGIGLLALLFVYRRQKLYQALAAEDEMITTAQAEKELKQKEKEKGKGLLQVPDEDIDDDDDDEKETKGGMLFVNITL